MTDNHPAYSYLDPATLEMALDLARRLRRASADVARLADGGPAIAYHYSGAGGRAADRTEAVTDWVGPHRVSFELLVEEELSDAATAAHRLSAEADAWSRFWTIAVTARNDRIHDEMTRMLPDRELSRPPPVSVPTVAGGVRPTG